MHPLLIQFLIRFRLSPLQCVRNNKFNLNLTVHDISYVYRLQEMGKKQYTLVSRNSQRKLVTGLPDSSMGRDIYFLVITRN